MKYRRFEDCRYGKMRLSWRLEFLLLLRKPDFKALRWLADQIERAVVSISNNIAEGFERGTTPELLTFLYISRGSAGETRSVLCLM